MKFKIATLGVMTTHKGLPLLRRCAEMARENQLPFEFIVIGPVDYPMPGDSFSVTGNYDNKDLDRIISEIQPALIWFPVRWPETFSFTLSSAIASGAAIAVPSIGALPERIEGRSRSVVYPIATTPAQLLELFSRIAASDFESIAVLRGRQEDFDEPAVPQRTSPPIYTFETRHSSGQYDACAYIRVRLPIRHASLGLSSEIVSLAPNVPFNREAAAVLVQRTAITDEGFARDLISRLEKQKSVLIYETDDDLFNIPDDHPEYAYYRTMTRAARLIAEAAQIVTTSSPALANSLRRLNSNTIVIPNALDEQLWFDGTTTVRPGDGIIRILYMGTATHSKDLAILEAPFLELRKVFADRVRLEAIGVSNNLPDWVDRIDVPSAIGASYPMFVQWLRSLRGRWDFAVAPLADTAFNEKKSFVKFLDYGALGLSGVFSNCAPYDELGRNHEPCILASPDASSWFDALKTHTVDASKRESLNRHAEYVVRTEYTLAAQGQSRRAVWQSILQSTAVSKS